MNKIIFILFHLVSIVIEAQDYYYQSYNVTRTPPSGLAAYRSALTLDWLAAEDSRQRDLVAAFETDPPPARFISTDCVAYPKPAPGKVARLMLELIKNLEGDDGILVPELVQVLIRSKLLVETSALEIEPDFDALVKTPGLMMGEPHSTLPRIVAAVWMIVTDSAATRKYGWCPIKQVSKYLQVEKPRDIAKHMKALEVIVARARFVMEEFIQNITPVNVYEGNLKLKNTPKRPSNTSKRRRMEKRPPGRRMEPFPEKVVMESQNSYPKETREKNTETLPTPKVIDESVIARDSSACVVTCRKFLLPSVLFIL